MISAVNIGTDTGGTDMEVKKADNPLWDSRLSTEEKLDRLVKELTIDEKLHMLASGSKGIERLGIPDCLLGGEAAHGVVARNWQNGEIVKDTTTSFPQPIGMSSSWASLGRPVQMGAYRGSSERSQMGKE